MFAPLAGPAAREVVAGLNAARAKQRRLSGELTEPFQLSGLLLQDRPLTELLSAIVTSVADVFAARQVTLFLPAADGRLEVAATAGEPLTDEQLDRVLPEPGTLAHLGADPGVLGDLIVLTLTASGRPVGLLALPADTAAGSEREPLRLFANQIALAVERAQLRDRVLQTRLTQEVSRLARTLVAGSGRDHRCPGRPARRPRANLLDMSRIQAGVLQPRCTVIPLADLVISVVKDRKPQLRGHLVQLAFPPDPPLVAADVVLISRVLTNLIENAIRHDPEGHSHHDPGHRGGPAGPPGLPCSSKCR
jgi:two-component system, OmpR family, sensor histidine kinase KdpD